MLRAVLQLWCPRQRSQRDAGEAIRRHVLWQRKLDLFFELVGRNKGADVAASLDGYLCVCVAHADFNPTATADLFQAKFTEMFAKVARFIEGCTMIIFIPVVFYFAFILLRKFIDWRMLIAENRRIRRAILNGERRTVGELFDDRPYSHHVS